jgi:hypothetical protein
MVDSKQAGEKQQDGEQTCECGICNPTRANRFSSFLQATSVKHVAPRSASAKFGTDRGCVKDQPQKLASLTQFAEFPTACSVPNIPAAGL